MVLRVQHQAQGELASIARQRGPDGGIPRLGELLPRLHLLRVVAPQPDLALEPGLLGLGRRVADLILQKGYRQTRTERMKTYALLLSALLASQTVVTPPENKYTPAQDVELGHKAAAEARQQEENRPLEIRRLSAPEVASPALKVR